VPEVFLSHPLQELELRRVFKDNTSGGPIPGNHWDFGSKLVGSAIKYKLEPSGKHQFVDIEGPLDKGRLKSLLEELASHPPSPLQGRIFKRLRAERDIVPEGDPTSWPPAVKEDGDKATETIVAFLTSSALPSDLVEVTLLHSLNTIYEPDCSFSRILVQRIGPGTTAWEVYLVEESTQIPIPLSQTGSGFKTILLTLIYLHLIPHIEGQPAQNYIFALEELENNVHPAVQRRLLSYIREFALDQKCYFFLTTHSNVIIDLFSRDDGAQIIHTVYDGEKAIAKRVQTYVENRGICDDLGVRASDLLQANSVFWVEGPSDRLYVNRWIEIWTDGALKEGVHYQCMFYAGRLLAHISAASPEESSNDAIPILRLNKNAIVLLDSDKEAESDIIGETKNRIAEEIKQMGGIAWITDGREVENYIPSEAVTSHYQKAEMIPLDRFQDIADYLERNVASGEGDRFERAKVEFAANICPLLTKDSLKGILDLPDRLTEVCGKIREWNKV